MGLTDTPSPNSPATRRIKMRQADLDFGGSAHLDGLATVPKKVSVAGQDDSTEYGVQGASSSLASVSGDANGGAVAENTHPKDVIRIVHGHTTRLNNEKQEKHIPGSHYYIPGKSILTISLQEAQELINQYAGTGKFIDSGYTRERVDFRKSIGIHVVLQTGEQITTTIGIIHYSQKGTHLVPAKPRTGD
ncbi:MAG: hypothetical protein IJJ33_10080 [Victivallales bacterium]|nr:hypothetical protein [Victivallales bacterium]